MTLRRSGLPLVVDPATSLRLSRVRQKGTSAELLVRSLLHRLGFRFRVGGRGLPGRPDVANVSRGWAVLVHGCYWHAHEGCRRATVPKRNRAFWEAKFAANSARDRRVLEALRAMGIRPVVVWECEVEERPAAVARRLRRVLA
jgi:DNA mismatch endonuclease (patch repair protein)